MKVSIEMVPANYSDANVCRKNGWSIGTRLVGDEGYGPTVIEITAIGESHILAKRISHAGVQEADPYEGSWTLRNRHWKEVKREKNQA